MPADTAHAYLRRALVGTAVVAGAAAVAASGLGAWIQGTTPAMPTWGASEPAVAPARPTQPQTQASYEAGILGRNVFFPGQEPGDRPVTRPIGAVASGLPVVLKGTVVAQPASLSAAFIQGERGTTVAYGIDQMVHDARIVEIQADRVRLDRDGQQSWLWMGQGSEAAPPASADARLAVPAGTGVSLGQVTAAPPTERVVPSRSADWLGQTTPFTTATGQRGLRLTGIRRHSVADQLGLRNGDVVHTMALHSISSHDDAQRALASLRSAERFVVSLTRRGEPLSLPYRLP